MAVTKDMKPIEIPVVALNPTSTEKLTPTDPALINKNLRTTKTVFRQGDLFELDGIYVNPNLKYKLNEQAEVQQPLVVDKADSAAQTTQKVNEPVVEKARKAPVVEQVRKAPVVTEEKNRLLLQHLRKKSNLAWIRGLELQIMLHQTWFQPRQSKAQHLSKG